MAEAIISANISPPQMKKMKSPMSAPQMSNLIGAIAVKTRWE